jgi:hypothetical protein
MGIASWQKVLGGRADVRRGTWLGFCSAITANIAL